MFLVIRDDAEFFPNCCIHKEFAETLQGVREKVSIKAAKIKLDISGDKLKLKFLGYIPVTFKKVI